MTQRPVKPVLVLPDPKAPGDPEVWLGPVVLPELPVPPELRARLDLPVLRARLDLPVLPVLPDQQAPRAMPVPRVPRVLPVPLAP